MDLSLIVPIHNQFENIENLYHRISSELGKLSLSSEIIFVDNGSKDGISDKVLKLKTFDKGIKLIVLSRTVSNTEAIMYGLDLASGQYIVTMDGDMGYDPADIIRFIIMIHTGYDVVCGWRKGKISGLLSKGLFPKIANAVISFMTKIKLHDIDCSFMGFRRRLLHLIKAYSDIYRFLPIIAASKGANVGEVEVTYPQKVSNYKVYNILQSWQLLLDIILLKILIDFSSRPVWLFSLISVPFWLAGIYFLSFYIYSILFYQQLNTIVIPGTGALYLFLSVSITTFGFISELIIKTGDDTKEIFHDN